MQRFFTGLATLVFLAACAPSNTNPAKTTPSARSTEGISPTEPSTPVAQTAPVEVQLVDFVIDMPTMLPSGVTTFNVVNAGQAPHNIEIEGNGIEVELENDLQAGETGTLQVELKPGTYKVYCPVGDHEERGMVLELVVN